MYIPSCSGKCYLGAKEDPPIFAEKELDRAIVQINGGDGKRERILSSQTKRLSARSENRSVVGKRWGWEQTLFYFSLQWLKYRVKLWCHMEMEGAELWWTLPERRPSTPQCSSTVSLNWDVFNVSQIRKTFLVSTLLRPVSALYCALFTVFCTASWFCAPE